MDCAVHGGHTESDMTERCSLLLSDWKRKGHTFAEHNFLAKNKNMVVCFFGLYS